MSPMLKRAAVVSLLMVATAVASALAIPRNKLADTRPVIALKTAVPMAFGNWKADPHMVPLPPSPDQQAVLDSIYDEILSRTYVNDRGERVMLSMTYGSKQNQQLRAHRQEVCYSAQGFKIRGLENLDLSLLGRSLPATRMEAVMQQRHEPVTYWFTMGDTVVRTYAQRELQQLKFAVSGYVPDGYLVRISTLGTDVPEHYALHRRFAEELLQAMPAELRARLIGPGA